jgi:hypothetical protein
VTVDPETEYRGDDMMVVAQQYIDSFLSDNKKFDLRLWVLVLYPLQINVYRDGLARFCIEVIDNDSPFGQLTNAAINHDSRILSETLERMRTEHNVDIDLLWRKIDAVIALTIISGISFISRGVESRFKDNGSYSRCFQILGFDILLDSDANPYLLEVNYRPSLDTHFPLERRIKVDMVRSSVLIGAPLKLAQSALSVRKWGWSEEAWQNFLNNSPEIARAARAEKKMAVRQSKYRKIWPSKEPNKAIWQRVLDTAKELPIEQIPGLSLRDINEGSFSERLPGI